ITTVAENGGYGFSGDGAAATAATMRYPWGMAGDSSGNLYIGDEYNHRVRKVSSGVISTIAGNGVPDAANGGQATQSSITRNYAVTTDSQGNIYAADTDGQRILKVTPGGVVNTIAGNGTRGFSGDGGLATAAALNEPNGIAVDASGNVFIA